MSFKITLLPDDDARIEKSKLIVMDEARNLVIDRLNYNLTSGRKGLDGKESLIALSLLNGKFWDTLAYVDGRGYNTQTKSSKTELRDQNNKVRKWALANLGYSTLEKILNIAVNQALLRPVETTAPGADIGHSIIYEELVLKEDSIFIEAVTPDLEKRLVNGRFWEELPDVSTINNGRSIAAVEYILESHFDDLDPDFCVKGFSLMEINRRGISIDDILLRDMRVTALNRYAKFIGKVDDTKKLSSEQIEQLLRPYISTVLSWDGDSNCPYYNNQVDYSRVKRGQYQDKLRNALVTKYLISSSNIQKFVATTLKDYIEDKYKRENPEYSRFVSAVLEIVASKEKVIEYMIEEPQSDEIKRFFDKKD